MPTSDSRRLERAEMLARARQGACSSLPAPVGHLRARRCTFFRLAQVYYEKACVFTCVGLENVQRTDVHKSPFTTWVAETDLDALRGSRLLHDQGDEKVEYGQVFFVDQLEVVFPEDLILKV